MDFQNSPLFARSTCFYVEILNVFNTLTLKQVFLQKAEYCFLVERTKIENASFPYKTTISKANVKANGMVSAKCAYHKD